MKKQEKLIYAGRKLSRFIQLDGLYNAIKDKDCVDDYDKSVILRSMGDIFEDLLPYHKLLSEQEIEPIDVWGFFMEKGIQLLQYRNETEEREMKELLDECDNLSEPEN